MRIFSVIEFYFTFLCQKIRTPKLIIVIFYQVTFVVGVMFAVTSCLPVETNKPQCFPEVGCEFGLACIQGKCEPPPSRTLSLELSCLSSNLCQENLMSREIQGMNESEEETIISNSDPDNTQEKRPQACLILEQPHHLSAYLVDLETKDIEVSLFEGSLRTSLLILDKQSVCPKDVEELKERRLHRTCSTDEGCLLRLRRPDIKVGADPLLMLSFSGELGQCLESTWAESAPAELCDDDDNDCDGFVDEGLDCSGGE